MPIISERDRATIAQMFEENLVEPVGLVYFTIPKSRLYVPGRQECETCDDVQGLLEEITEISDKLTLEVHNLQHEPDVAKRYGVDRVPALLLGPDDRRIRYYGAPAGYEFSALLQDIQMISSGEVLLEPGTRDALAAIAEPVHLQVFVTPT